MSAVFTLPDDLDTLYKLLPRSATQLERDLLKVTSSDALRAAGLELVSWKWNPSADAEAFLPLILIERGLAEHAKLFKDYRALLAAGKRIKGKWGTPYAIEEMARIMRFDNAEIWEEPEPTIHFPEFQMELGQYEWVLSRLATLRKLVNLVKPARGRFRRVYHGYDERQFLWDDSTVAWGGFWDDDSGVDLLKTGAYGPHRSDDRFIVSMGQIVADDTTIPTLIIGDGDDDSTIPPILIHRFFDTEHTEDFDVRLDETYLDGESPGDFDMTTSSNDSPLPAFTFHGIPFGYNGEGLFTHNS